MVGLSWNVKRSQEPGHPKISTHDCLRDRTKEWSPLVPTMNRCRKYIMAIMLRLSKIGVCQSISFSI